jgi:hypothetical protein
MIYPAPLSGAMLAGMTDSPIFALVDVHVALWVELLAAADRDEPVCRLALAAWRRRSTRSRR